jgi:KaiC/GvpD/RAD55 family RecA-like ATPase
LSRDLFLSASALAYATELGWAVFPLKPRDKAPLTVNGFKDASTSAEQIGEWWERWPEANIGIATGEASGIIVVDVDGPAGEATLSTLCELPVTPISHTGKGRHIVFARGSLTVRNSAGKLGPQLDVRGEGGYIVAPPSVHPSGHRYAWARDSHPIRCGLAALPQEIVARLSAQTMTRTPASAIPVMGTIGNGTRNATLTEYAGRLLAMGHGELETVRLLGAVNQTQCRPPLAVEEVEAIVVSIGAAERRKPSRIVRWDDALPAPSRPRAMTRVAEPVFEALAARNVAPIQAVPTMLPEWNDACRGFGGAQGLARGWHVTVGGASGTGKSLFALNLAVSALRAGRSVLYVSLEMAGDQLLSRLLAMVSRCPVRELEPGHLYSPESWARASAAFSNLCAGSGASLVVADRPSNQLADLIPLAKEGIADGATLVVIDYVQLIQVRGTDGIYERTTQASQAIQRLAFDHNVVTLALSQFNRSTSFNKDAPPSPESLTGSSAIENDSDQVVLLDHSANKRFGNRMETNVLVAKNRHGPVPSIPVIWDYTTLEVKQRTPDALARPEDRYGF